MGKKKKKKKKHKLAVPQKDPTALLTSALSLHQKGEFSIAKKMYHEILASDPNHADANHLLGLVEYTAGNHKQACDYIKKAIAINSKIAFYHYNLGTVYHELRDLEEAIGHYSQAIVLDPNYVQAHENLGGAFEKKGEYQQALVHYKKGLTLAPNNAISQQGVVSCLGHVNNSPSLQDLQAYFQFNNVKYEKLVDITAEKLIVRYNIDKIYSLCTSHFQIPTAIFSDQLLTHMLQKTLNTNVYIEAFLVKIRRTILETYHCHPLPQEYLSFVVALAQQCFFNEFIFPTCKEEMNLVHALCSEIEQALVQENLVENGESKLLLLSLYLPLSSLSLSHKLNSLPLEDFSSFLQPILQINIGDFYEEQKLKENIDQLKPIVNEISQKVQQQYEENPYPRWFHIVVNEPKSTIANLKSMFTHFQPPQMFKEKVEILVAGCGTGRHPIETALSHQNAQVLAVDLSKSSVAYAWRMAKKLKVKNIQFLQADILALASLTQKFHIVECCGVLHHLKEPMEGWKTLCDLLLPQGLMRIGLYSQLARRSILKARKLTNHLAYTLEEIKEFRYKILQQNKKDLLHWRDFYSLSSFRDLVFHIQEHQCTLPQIQKSLKELSLSFIGFEKLSAKVEQQYLQMFSENEKKNDLALWHQYETQYPDTFIGMYNFWCQKE